MPRIASVKIESFRGVPDVLEIDLRRTPKSSPGSLLLLGDNGSGKSSVADALEFVLRASLLRRIDPERPVKRHARSFATAGKPYVEVTYADGTRIGRGAPGANRYGDGVAKVTGPQPAFSQAPVVLRRSDVLGFWSLPEDRRKLVFFDYFRAPDLTTAQQLEAARVADQRDAERPQLSECVAATRRALKIQIQVQTRKVPTQSAKLREFRASTLATKFGTGEQGRYGEALLEMKVQIAYRALLDAVLALEENERQAQLARVRADGTKANRVHAEVEATLTQASQFLTESFLATSPSAVFIDAVELITEADSNSLSVALRLKNGQRVDPEDILSEANLDLLALLLYVAIVEASAAYGQFKLLVLDDVFQSVDTVVRHRATQYLIGRLKDWQLVITTHDRLWFTLLGETLRQANVPFVPREIVRWTFDQGPEIRDAVLAPSRGLSAALNAHDPVAICAMAGVLLEQIADRLSWTIGTSVPRRRGDRYTLGDLWPGVLKKLRKTDAQAEAEAAEASAMLRNLVGAHFNEWAHSISLQEATHFGEVVDRLLQRAFCQRCGSWLVPGSPSASSWACPCGVTEIRTA